MGDGPIIKVISRLWNPGPVRTRVSLLSGFLILAAIEAPAIVGSLEGYAAPMGSAFLRWEDITTTEEGFLIERRSGDGDFEEVVITPPNVTNYTDTGLEPGKVYTYRVSAVVDRVLPPQEVTLEAYPEWNGGQAPLEMTPAVSGGTRVSYTPRGAVYTAQQSTDLLAWEALGEPRFLGPLDEPVLELPYNEEPLFLRVLSSGVEHPLEVGLDRPFELPPEPDGAVLDVTDFGASTISETNDDAIGFLVAFSIAEPGDEVFIPAGRYTIRQTLEIPSGVSLRGAGKDETVLVTEGIATAIRVLPEAHDIRISDFTITHEGDEEELSFGVYIGSVRQGRNSYRILVESLRIERFAIHGVSLRDCHHVLVQDCEILNATNLGGGGRGYGIALNYPTNHNNWIRRNTIGPVIRHAVLLQYFAHNNLVEENLAVENSEDAYDLHGEDEYLNELRFNIARDGARDGFGVGNTGSTHDRSGPNNWIHHNTVENSRAGLEIIQASEMVFVDHNTFIGNEFGIRVHNLGGRHLYLRGNTFKDNETGILLTSAHQVWVLGNTFTGQTEAAVDILANVQDLVEEGNVFSGNAVDVRPYVRP